MSLTVTFTDQEEIDLQLLYVQITLGDDPDEQTRAEQAVVTLLAKKLGAQV